MRVSYSNKDFQSIKDQLVDLIKDYTDKWTDYLESDVGVIILTQMAAIGDMLAYSLDRQAGEVYSDSAQERKNIKSIFSIIGYRLRHYTSAKTIITIKSLVTENLLIPRYTHLVTKEDVTGEVLNFVVDDDYIIPFSDGVTYSEKQVGILQGYYEYIEKTYNDIYDDNKFIISREVGQAIAEGSTTLYIDGVRWLELEDVYLTDKPMGRYYHMEVDIDDNVIIVLHPRWRDLVSFPREMKIKVEYVMSAGEKGNIGPNLIVGFSDPVKDIRDDDVTDKLVVIQDIPARGGADPETIEEARINGPRRARTVWTAITKEDYKILSESDPEVHRAKAIDVNDDFTFEDGSKIDEPFYVRVALVPLDFELPSMVLRQRVYEYLAERKVGTIDLGVIDPEYQDIDLQARITLGGSYRPDDARRDIEKGLGDYFRSIDFDENIYRSKLSSIIFDSCPHVSDVVITSPSDDVLVEGIQFPRLVSIELVFE